VFNDNGSFLLALFEFFLFFAWFMCLFWVIGDIFRSKDMGGGAKTFWVFFVIFLPWLGILVYLIARGGGKEKEAERAFAAAEEAVLTEVVESPNDAPWHGEHYREGLARTLGSATVSMRRWPRAHPPLHDRILHCRSPGSPSR